MSLMNLMTRVLGFQAAPEKPLISLVLLLNRPRTLEDEAVRQAAEAALAKHYGTADEGSLVVGETPSFVVTSRDRSFVVTHHSGSYAKDPRKAARHVTSEAVRQAFQDHSAWISVDLLRPQNPEGLEFVECMCMLGKLAAELIDGDCLLVLSPHSGQMRPYDATVKEKLAGDNPFDAFREAHGQLAPAAVAVANKPPAPAAASRLSASLEAQRRWPEFLDAFQHRQSGQMFSVKANVSDGRSREPVWIKVYNIHGESIAGLIDSHPSRLTALKQGDRVSASSSEISDWMFVKQGNLVGGFSERGLSGRVMAGQNIV